MKLLDNAIISIQLGIDDFKNPERNRYISAIRNLHAGILLLYKEKLLRISPEYSQDVLIKEKIIPHKNSKGKLIFIGVGRKTLNVQQIRDRFLSLDIKTDWKSFENISKIRNEVEHYFCKSSKDSIRGVLSNTFTIIRDFIKDELNEDPLILLGDKYWQCLLENSEIYEKELLGCQEQINKIDWNSENLENAIMEYYCLNCGSQLLSPITIEDDYLEVILKCKSCGYDMKVTDILEDALRDYYEWETYLHFTDGNEESIISCPNCSSDSYIVEEGLCTRCGYTREYIVLYCSFCGEELNENDDEENCICIKCVAKMDQV